MSPDNVRQLHRPADLADEPLRILRVIPPEPGFGPGSYEVRLELSRRLTVHEDEALHRAARGLHAVGRELTLYDTTLEKVGARAADLAELVARVEEEGRRLEQARARRTREFTASREQRANEMAAVAARIRFQR